MTNNDLDKFTAIAQRQQEAVAAAIRTWAEDAQRYAAAIFSPDAKVPTSADAQQLVNTYFDAATKALAEQRALATTLVETTGEATEVAAAKVRDFKIG